MREIESDVVASAPRVSILAGAKVSRTRKVTAWVKRSNAVGKESERERRREGKGKSERADETEAEGGGGGRYLTR